MNRADHATPSFVWAFCRFQTRFNFICILIALRFGLLIDAGSSFSPSVPKKPKLEPKTAKKIGGDKLFGAAF